MRHISNRKKFCMNMLKKSKEELNKIVYSDECRIDLYPKGRIFVRTTPYLQKKFKYVRKTFREANSSINIWGCIKSNGERCIKLFKNNLDSYKYQSIIEETYLPTHQEDHVFMQDGAKCHTSRSTMRYFETKGVTVMGDWPAQSPDLNPIENLWAYLKFRLRNYETKNIDQLWTNVCNEFNNIPNSYITKLYDSVPKRLRLCLYNKGWHTKY